MLVVVTKFMFDKIKCMLNIFIAMSFHTTTLNKLKKVKAQNVATKKVIIHK